MSVDTKKYEYLLTRETVNNPQPYSKPVTTTSSTSKSNPRTSSTSAAYPSAASPDYFT